MKLSNNTSKYIIQVRHGNVQYYKFLIIPSMFYWNLAEHADIFPFMIENIQKWNKYECVNLTHSILPIVRNNLNHPTFKCFAIIQCFHTIQCNLIDLWQNIYNII